MEGDDKEESTKGTMINTKGEDLDITSCCIHMHEDTGHVQACKAYIYIYYIVHIHTYTLHIKGVPSQLLC